MSKTLRTHRAVAERLDERLVDDAHAQLERLEASQFPDAPATMLVSREADVYPRNHPERADEIEGNLGDGYYFVQRRSVDLPLPPAQIETIQQMLAGII